MSDRNVSPYGSWKSPFTPDVILSELVRPGQICLDGDDVYWIENRSSDGGRRVIVRRSAAGSVTDMIPPSFNARTRVHEYGGGDFVVDKGVVYFANYTDQALYRQLPGASPEPMTGSVNIRYADMIVDRQRDRLICVCEDHTNVEREAVNMIISLPLTANGATHILAAGNDFYSNPRLSPDGSRLAWTTWNHPNMPWDSTELWVADLDESGFIRSAQRVAGGPDESIFQPEWSPSGELYFVSDSSGWWNLYRSEENMSVPICPKEAEFGSPQWVFGLSQYAFVSSDRIICWYSGPDESHLAFLDTQSGALTPIAIPYTTVQQVRANAQHVLFVGASPTTASQIVRLDLADGRLEVLRGELDLHIDPGFISIAQEIEFPTEHNLTAYAYYYPPQNSEFQAPPDELPPLLVLSHGGPTSDTTNALDLHIQYWTSRGFAVLDVNYGGSTGFGRAYRERLKGQWGIVDVDDCVNGARYLVEHHLVDGDRLTIQGGSAGGYTTLCALTFRDLFKAGASYYGVSDLVSLCTDTHKFESRYNFSLVGPYPEARDVYYQRSPIHFVDQIVCPIIFFQGLEDQVVLPDQAEKMVEALRRKHLPVAYIAFEGEQHGFRRSENIKRTLDAQLYFFSRIFHFQLPEDVEPVLIENLQV